MAVARMVEHWAWGCPFVGLRFHSHGRLETTARPRHRKSSPLMPSGSDATDMPWVPEFKAAPTTKNHYNG